MKIGELVQSGDFKSEKHVPLIEAPEKVKAGEQFFVKVSVGKEIPHPNTPAHHICWLQLYFLPEGGKLVIEVAKFDYAAHSDTMNAENPGPISAGPASCVPVKLTKSGKFFVQSYCNIHGLWESSCDITVE